MDLSQLRGAVGVHCDAQCNPEAGRGASQTNTLSEEISEELNAEDQTPFGSKNK